MRFASLHDLFTTSRNFSLLHILLHIFAHLIKFVLIKLRSLYAPGVPGECTEEKSTSLGATIRVFYQPGGHYLPHPKDVWGRIDISASGSGDRGLQRIRQSLDTTFWNFDPALRGHRTPPSDGLESSMPIPTESVATTRNSWIRDETIAA
jgi:hypothetical protein